MIKINYKKFKELLKYSIKLLPLYTMPIVLSGCSMSSSKDPMTGNIEFESGEHKLIEVYKNISMYGRDGLYYLDAPRGYRVVDYDYDFLDGIEYNDFLYENMDKIKTNDRNNFGISENTSGEDFDNIYLPNEHNLVSISRSLKFLGKINEKKTLTAPLGYKVVDYDYDMVDDQNLQFENITYANMTRVKVDNKNEFGEPLKPIDTKYKNYYDEYEHTIVEINRDFKISLGKSGEKTITAPPGYEIVDYDYDKLRYSEFETILYRNNVKVEKIDNDFGKPLEDTKEIDEALVIIDRTFNTWIGFDKLREANAIENMELIDYDYDKNDMFEFETYVYKKVK